jgi:transposase-like protein
MGVSYFIDMKKVCNRCNIEKDITDYYVSKHGRDGYMPKCKICHNLYTQKRGQTLKADDMYDKSTVDGFKKVMEGLGYDHTSDISEQFKQRVMDKYGVNLR